MNPARLLRRPTISLVLCSVLFSLTCRAADVPVNAPPHIDANVPKARLAGQGNYRWFGLKIYDAQLWVGEKGYLPAVPAAAPFALDLRYARDLVGAKIAQASFDEMTHIGSGTTEQRQAWLLKMRQLFPDVHEGTHITGILLPAQGARFYLDGKLLGEVLDPAFAEAFFGIWLDPKTSAAPLRSALLANAAPR